jgi:hypothetical protein
MRSGISSDRRCGWRRLNRPAIACRRTRKVDAAVHFLVCLPGLIFFSAFFGRLPMICEATPDSSAPQPDLVLWFFCRGQMQLVAAGENLSRLLLAQRIPYDRIVFIGGQNQPQRRVIALAAPFPIEIIDEELHLAEVAMNKLAHFKIDRNEALQNGVIENQIDIKMIAVQCDTLLP